MEVDDCLLRRLVLSVVIHRNPPVRACPLGLDQRPQVYNLIDPNNLNILKTTWCNDQHGCLRQVRF